MRRIISIKDCHRHSFVSAITNSVFSSTRTTLCEFIIRIFIFSDDFFAAAWYLNNVKSGTEFIAFTAIIILHCYFTLVHIIALFFCSCLTNKPRIYNRWQQQTADSCVYSVWTSDSKRVTVQTPEASNECMTHRCVIIYPSINGTVFSNFKTTSIYKSTNKL